MHQGGFPLLVIASGTGPYLDGGPAIPGPIPRTHGVWRLCHMREKLSLQSGDSSSCSVVQWRDSVVVNLIVGG